MKVGVYRPRSMGSAMARNLIKAGHTVVVYNRTRSRAEELQTRGAKVAGTPGEAATAAEVLITMLGDDRALEDAMLGPGRALQSLPAGAVHVGMSTISVALSRRLVAAHWERRQYYVAAPVFGRTEAAAEGSSSSLPPGQSNKLTAARRLFDVMGQKAL
jgi:3-hydroxyisobutyrate dehydrogenase-like beta-hydroxyacid dehydrogenase